MELAAYFLPNIQFSSSSLCKLGPNPVFMRWGINPIEASVCWPLDPGAQSRAHRGSTRLLLARETHRASARGYSGA